jgi:hypothetical protein
VGNHGAIVRARKERKEDGRFRGDTEADWARYGSEGFVYTSRNEKIVLLRFAVCLSCLAIGVFCAWFSRGLVRMDGPMASLVR